MTSRLNPYISFGDNARQAMEFYQSIFGGELTIGTFGEFGAPDPATADLVMHGWLVSPSGYNIMGADTPPGMDRQPGNNITISLSGDDADELRGYWEKLSEGGAVTIEKQVWGDEFGQCADKFGINWLVNIGQSAN